MNRELSHSKQTTVREGNIAQPVFDPLYCFLGTCGHLACGGHWVVLHGCMGVAKGAETTWLDTLAAALMFPGPGCINSIGCVLEKGAFRRRGLCNGSAYIT